MEKKYIKPTTKVINVDAGSLLSGSSLHQDKGNGVQLSKDMNQEWDDND